MDPHTSDFTLNILTENVSENIGLLIAFILLIIVSAFFSSAETAYSTVNIIRLRNFLEEKKKGAKKAVYIAEKFDFTLITILIGKSIVNIGAVTIAAYLIGKLISDPTAANLTSVLVMVILILFFTEMLPKQHAKEHPEQTALRTSGLLYLIIKLLFPSTWLYAKIRNAIVRKTEKKPNPLVTEQELESIIDVMENEGVIDENDAELFQNAMGLSEQTAYDIMTPRVDIIAVDANMSIDEIKQVFFDQQFSRIPVYRGDKDNIIGILSEKDFFTALLKNETIDIEKLISKPYYVSKSTKVDDLIKEMQKQKKHFAIVADEYGGTMGIVTMEDALEELVGEIYDEFDEVNDADFVKLEENRYQLSTDMDLEELFDTLKLGKVPDTSYTNVGGFVYEMCDGLPAEGKTVHCTSVYEDYDDLENPIIRHYDLEFVIRKVENRRIRSVELKVTPIPEQLAETDK